jgi:8-oxo-dGTP pyrophosphatase MutT (NUDIX family)
VEQWRLLSGGRRMTLVARLQTALSETQHHPVPYASDSRHQADSPGTPAAVLIAITDRADPGLILTQRPDTMRRHAGQVAFPGGRIDPDDSDAIDAALREAEEEVALPRAHVDIVDTLQTYRTITGFDITPVIGVIPPDLPLVPHVREVAAVFEVPLSFIFDPANRVEQRVMVEGSERRYFEIMWGERRIWGATAAMLANLSVRLKW